MDSAQQQDGSKGRPDVLDWFVRIHARRNALGENYTVFIYFGEPPSAPDKWRSSPNLVGSHTVLRGGFGGGRNELTEGFVHINKHLSNRGMLSKTEGEIENFIREKIEWRILKVDGEGVPAEKVTDLEIAVMTILLRWNEEDEIYEVAPGARPVHRNLTSGRPGGRDDDSVDVDESKVHVVT